MSTLKCQRQVFELPDNGFDILHDPKDGSECQPDETGICKNIDHLFPISKTWSTPNA